MSCYHPLTAYRDLVTRSVIFNERGESGETVPLTLPCGQCFGCRLERSRQWAVRCVHEASLHEFNSFLTLTYNPASLPLNRSLDKSHFQKFMKRLRFAISPIKIRFYMCGEYGDLNKRPHYHAIIFGYDFPDKELYKTVNGMPLYISSLLAKYWGKGFCTIGNVTFKSAAYVARYIMKKMTGDRSKQWYSCLDKTTGEVWDLLPEYNSMSLKPGIAYDWYEKFKHEVYPADEVIINGKQVRPPKYYDLKYAADCPDSYLDVAMEREFAAYENRHDNTPERLKVRETVKKAQCSTLIRPVDDKMEDGYISHSLPKHML